jgi:hypothetical protein
MLPTLTLEDAPQKASLLSLTAPAYDEEALQAVEELRAGQV